MFGFVPYVLEIVIVQFALFVLYGYSKKLTEDGRHITAIILFIFCGILLFAVNLYTLIASFGLFSYSPYSKIGLFQIVSSIIMYFVYLPLSLVKK